MIFSSLLQVLVSLFQSQLSVIVHGIKISMNYFESNTTVTPMRYNKISSVSWMYGQIPITS